MNNSSMVIFFFITNAQLDWIGLDHEEKVFLFLNCAQCTVGVLIASISNGIIPSSVLCCYFFLVHRRCWFELANGTSNRRLFWLLTFLVLRPISNATQAMSNVIFYSCYCCISFPFGSFIYLVQSKCGIYNFWHKLKTQSNFCNENFSWVFGNGKIGWRFSFLWLLFSWKWNMVSSGCAIRLQTLVSVYITLSVFIWPFCLCAIRWISKHFQRWKMKRGEETKDKDERWTHTWNMNMTNAFFIRWCDFICFFHTQ